MIGFPLYELSTGSFTDTKWSGGCLGLGLTRELEGNGMIANKRKISLWGDKNVPKLMMVMMAQLCECTKGH